MSPQRILVIRRDNIGDLVCTTPFLHTLRQAFPAAHIAVLVNSYNRAVLWQNTDVDEVISYDKLKHKNGIVAKTAALFSRICLLIRLRRHRFDLTIIAKPSLDLHALRTARWSGSKKILGFAPSCEQAPRGLTDPVAANHPHLHEVEAVAQLASHLGIAAKPGPLRLFPDPVLQARYRQPLKSNSRAQRWVALHISAREKSRQWPAVKFIELIKRLGGEAGLSDLGFVLLWSPGAANNPAHPGDDDKAEEIFEHTRQFPVLPLQTEHLEELIAGLSVCDAFVGADGGAMHVAAGVGLPLVALFENSQAKREHWYPWQSTHRLLQPTSFPVADIDVDSVVSAVRELIGTSQPSPNSR